MLPLRPLAASRRPPANQQPTVSGDFVVGAENAVLRHVDASFNAWMESRDVPQENPLLLCGSSGVGKSHIALGFVGRWRENRPKDLAILTSAADFARTFADAAKSDDLSRQRKRFRDAALCVVEDVQQLRKKTLAQHELARILEARTRKRQPSIVTASDVPARLVGLVPTLRSRLIQGLCLTLKPPGADARRYLLQQIAEKQKLSLAPAALDTLTEVLAGATVPELQARVLGIRATASDASISQTDVESQLDHTKPSAADTIRLILQITAKAYGLRVRDLTGKSRQRSNITPRCLAMLLSREFTDATLQSIGRKFGNRDHTTVLHACRKAQNLLLADNATRSLADRIAAQLQAERIAIEY